MSQSRGVSTGVPRLDDVPQGGVSERCGHRPLLLVTNTQILNIVLDADQLRQEGHIE